MHFVIFFSFFDRSNPGTMICGTGPTNNFNPTDNIH